MQDTTKPLNEDEGNRLYIVEQVLDRRLESDGVVRYKGTIQRTTFALRCSVFV